MQLGRSAQLNSGDAEPFWAAGELAGVGRQRMWSAALLRGACSMGGGRWFSANSARLQAGAPGGCVRVKTAPEAASRWRLGSGGFVCGDAGSRMRPSISSARAEAWPRWSADDPQHAARVAWKCGPRACDAKKHASRSADRSHVHTAIDHTRASLYTWRRLTSEQKEDIVLLGIRERRDAGDEQAHTRRRAAAQLCCYRHCNCASSALPPSSALSSAKALDLRRLKVDSISRSLSPSRNSRCGVQH